jgi:Pectate lyase superfamily protein
MGTGDVNLSRRALLRSTAGLVAPFLLSPALRSIGESAQLNVRDYGAKGNGKSKDTGAIQAAIDAAGRSGGTIYVPPGEYVSGTLRLRDRIVLRLGAGATLIASADDADFDPYEALDYKSFADRETTDFTFALLQGRALQDIGIFGPGRIDGNRTTRGGPKPIALKLCRNIQIHDLTIDNAPNYNISLLGCDNVDIVGVTIRNGYSDGIDPDCCKNVRIANCRIESRDDAIVAKASLALGVRRSTENVLVTDCSLVNVRNALKLGTESSGDFRNIVFRNCTISGRSVGWKPYPDDWKPQPSAGISLITVDGGSLERVRVSGITMAGVRAPLFVRLGKRGLGQTVRAAGELKDVSIAHIVAAGATWPSSITGIPGHPISNISLKDIRITGKGGGKAALLSRELPELEKQYPDATMFRDLPTYGLYCRHVNDLRADQLDLAVEQPDARPAVVLDDVRQADLRAIAATPSADGGPAFWFRSVRDVTLHGLRRRAGAKTLVRLSGSGTARVRLVGDDLSPVDQAVMIDPEVDAEAVRVENDVTRG